MHTRRWPALVACGVLLAVVAVPALVTLRATAAGPTVDGKWWTPRYPIFPENVTLYADVTSPDGISTIFASYCFLGGLCTLAPLTDPGTGIYEAVVYTNSLYVGAQYEVTVVDNNGNSTVSAPDFILFADSVNITFTEPVFAVEPSGTVAIGGMVLYEANASAPSEGLSVQVSIPGSSDTVVVAANGSFEANLVAPAAEGSYDITATTSDRSLSDNEQASLAVSSVPRPDLRVEDIRLPTPMVAAGQTVRASIDLVNVGTADATDVAVVIDVVRGSGATRVLETTVDMSAGGTVVTITAEWTAVAGAQTLRVSIDPDGLVGELDETNNVSDAALSIAAAPGIPLAWMIAGILAAVGIGSVLLVRRRRARPESPDSDGGKAK